MKNFTKLMLMIAAVMMVVSGCQKSDDGISVSLKSSAVQTVVANWTSGDAAAECLAAGGNCGYAYKIDEWDEMYGMDGVYKTMEGNTITILNSDGKTFDFTSESLVCKVIVKAGRGAIIYSYPDGVYADQGLLGFQGKGISHVTFCYAEPPEKIIAVKARYNWYPSGTTQAAEDNCESAGMVAFTEGWCTILGYNPYPSTASFDMVRQGVVVGNVVVNEDGDVTVTMNEGKILIDAFVFIGTLEELQTMNLKDGCPIFTNAAVWIPNTNAQTDGDGLSYMFFDL
ncbi:MAG TPA: hypothetical protein PLV06_12080 [Bacteroidales bacterium]|nr:hypothetical protein [Bacteroidales bacterium]HPJ60181.1 hypothetical protein [Bacteroidales bacterium]HPR13117.1 hypothetical protein [Bacteroidales bacterium]